ncbi:hypothetical protein ZHAS_00013823 [Anopheles sinensis]|uniref:Uncharacterized protein n=1 Tax=Anopheles sinensis TaxID=74873 RepID=A0A084W6M1_ANOSI|nr:hypothetical protein ZHAS_00013823 [Anopheles sinensis]
MVAPERKDVPLKQFRKFAKSGVNEKKTLYPSLEGTPDNEIVSIQGRSAFLSSLITVSTVARRKKNPAAQHHPINGRFNRIRQPSIDQHQLSARAACQETTPTATDVRSNHAVDADKQQTTRPADNEHRADFRTTKAIFKSS